MKRLAVLALVPLLAGCFAWDIDEKPLPWFEDPDPKPASIGRVVYHAGEDVPGPEPIRDDWLRSYDVRLHPKRGQVRAAEVRPAPMKPIEAGRDIPPAPRPAKRVAALEAAVETAPAPDAEPASPGAGDAEMDERLTALESRLEELYQLILKSYEKK